MQRRHDILARRSRTGRAGRSTAGLSLESLEQRCVPAGLAIGDVVVTEGTSGTRFVEVPVTLSAPAAKTVQVNFQTVAGSARAGSDFTAVSGTLSFAVGQTRQVIRVPIIGDRVPEFNESFEVVLQRARNATITDGRGSVLIQDSSPRLSVKAANSVMDADDGVGGTLLFTVSLSAAYDQPVTVQFQTADGLSTPGLADGAKAGEDYVAATGTLTFAPGETRKTISIRVLGDTTPEYDEMLRIFLFNATGALLMVSDASAEGYIYGKRGTPPGEFIG